MTSIIERAEVALEGITPGPWVANDSEDSCLVCGVEIQNAAGVAIGIKDVDFIAAARTLVPELIAELKAARRKLWPDGTAVDRREER